MTERRIFTDSYGRTTELHEAGGFSKLWFDGLQIGDILMLSTSSGSAYTLYVRDNRSGIHVDLRREGDDEMAGDDSTAGYGADDDSLFALMGNCSRVLTDVESDVAVIDGVEGHFELDRRAWLKPLGDGEHGTLITTPLTAISLIPAI